MAKKNVPMTLSLPDIGEGGYIVPGENTVKAIAKLLSARGSVQVELRPLAKDDNHVNMRFHLFEVQLSRNDITDMRELHYADVVIEGRDAKKGEQFIGVAQFYLSSVSASGLLNSFPQLGKEVAAALAPTISGVLEMTGELEREAEDGGRSAGLAESLRTLTDLLKTVEAKGKSEKPAKAGGLKIKLRASDD